jgi:hypothetical protein
MSSTAQILANRLNAEKSSGPVTAEGKARVSQNAIKSGLFSVANFVRPEEKDIFNQFESGYLSELVPDSPLEQTLAREIIHAAWRLRRCADLEVAPPANLTEEELDRLQISIDRARSAAQRTFHRSLKELRQLQAERACATVAAREAASQHSAKQTQPAPDKTPRSAPAILRGAPCPCRSGQNDERSRTGQALAPELVCSR